MTTDLYAKCPCGSGKKIKFCCRDIITDIERIERMLEGEQRSAALDKVDKLLQKHPGRPALLSLKGLICLELHQADGARAAVDQLLATEPQNPAGLAMRATLYALDGDLVQSLQQLHRALRLSDGVLSPMTYQSYLSVCVALIQHGEYIPAFAHLLTLVSITKGQDRSSVSLLMNVSSSPRLPAIFQGLMVRDEAPENVTWKREFDVAIDMYRSGDWSEAAVMLDDMSGRILDEPALLRNQAILQTWTCQTAKAIKSFRYYAAIPNVDLHDAVEAEACAQVLESASSEDRLPVRRISCDIDDAKSVTERLLSSDRARSQPVQAAPDSNEPPPLGQFDVYDRPVISNGTNPDATTATDLADCPRQLGSLLVFGRETDRSARLVLLVVEDDSYEKTLDVTQQLCGVSLAEDVETTTIAETHRVEQLLRPSFLPPEKMSIDEVTRLQREWLTHQLSEVWPNTPLGQFDGKTAREAAGEKKLQRAVLAAILNLEMWADRQPFDFDFDQLRADLGLPTMTAIDPNEVQLRTLSPAQLCRMELDKLTNEDLAYVFEIVSVRPPGSLLYRIGQEILKRPDLGDHVDLIEVHERMAGLCRTSDEQLYHVQQARDIAVDAGSSPASWVIAEFDLRIQRGEADIAQRLMTEIQARYLKEPGIFQQLTAVLEKYGLTPAAASDGPATAPPSRDSAPTEAPAAGGSSSGVWTPDTPDADPSPTGESGQKSQLWVPGMD